MTYDEFIQRIWAECPINSPKYAKCVMIWLYRTNPTLYGEIAGTDHDCYYDNSKVESTLSYIRSVWPNKSIDQ